MKTGYNRRWNHDWVITLDKLYSKEELTRLKNWVAEQKKMKPKNRKAIKDWFSVECLTNTGLRVAELADLRCGDIIIRGELSCVKVRNGKYHKSREVSINDAFQKESMEYLRWKEIVGEPVGPDDVLLYSPKSKSKYSTRTIELWCKRWLKELGISLLHTVHHFRHTYATMLYESSNHNLRLVQKQLGHSRSEITEVYADVFISERKYAVEHLF